MVPVSLRAVRTTVRISCGPRRARALPATFRGDVGRSRDSKARDRPDRQLHALVIGPGFPVASDGTLEARAKAKRPIKPPTIAPTGTNAGGKLQNPVPVNTSAISPP